MATDNKALGVVETLINDSIMSGLTPVAEQLIPTLPYMAWLKFPVVNQIFCYFLEKATQWFSVVLQVRGVKLVVTIQTDSERNTFSQAEGALRAALLGDNKDAIAKAKKTMDDAADALIGWDGANPVLR